jgi:ABC-2 type transport system permease protein
LWENRWLYIAPLWVAGLFLCGFLIGTVRLPREIRGLSMGFQSSANGTLATPYNFAEFALMAAMFVVALFYSLESLYGERRDRSILFWKSLPVSDLTTVLSKACIPVLVLPLITFALTVVTHCAMLLLASVVLLADGQSLSILWRHLPLPVMWVALFYHLLCIHGLWYAPFYGWLMLVSAWARRAPFLWALLPPFAIGVVEKVAFNTTDFGKMLADRFSGGPDAAEVMDAGMSIHMLAHLHPVRFLLSPGLWVGFAFAAACWFAAVRLRRYRGPI